MFRSHKEAELGQVVLFTDEQVEGKSKCPSSLSASHRDTSRSLSLAHPPTHVHYTTRSEVGVSVRQMIFVAQPGGSKISFCIRIGPNSLNSTFMEQRTSVTKRRFAIFNQSCFRRSLGHLIWYKTSLDWGEVNIISYRVCTYSMLPSRISSLKGMANTCIKIILSRSGNRKEPTQHHVDTRPKCSARDVTRRMLEFPNISRHSRPTQYSPRWLCRFMHSFSNVLVVTLRIGRAVRDGKANVSCPKASLGVCSVARDFQLTM